MAERNPNQALAELYLTTDREFIRKETDPNYRLYVADLSGRVVGFCRYYHSAGLPPTKKKYPAPEGWYGMGILVNRDFRRQGIARFLSENRMNQLKESGAKEIYSIVDATNLTSCRMHREFGYEEIGRGPGFLHIECEADCILYCAKLYSYAIDARNS